MPRKHPKRVPMLAVRTVAFYEGFLSDPSDALDGHATVGYGHLIHLGPVTQRDREKWSNLSREKGAALLRADLHEAAAEVRRQVHVPLNRRQFSALISFVYNCGPSALAVSTLLKRLNAGDYAAVPHELQKWVYSNGQVLPGLVTRRKKEGETFRPLHKPNPKFWR